MRKLLKMALEDLILPRPFFCLPSNRGRSVYCQPLALLNRVKRIGLAGISRKLRIKNKETEEMVDKNIRRNVVLSTGKLNSLKTTIDAKRAIIKKEGEGKKYE